MTKKGFTLLEAIISLFLVTTIISLVALYQTETNQLLKEIKLKRLMELQLAVGLEDISREAQKSTKLVEMEPHKITFLSSSFSTRGKFLKTNEEKKVSYFLGIYNQSFSSDYELPKYGLMRKENITSQPVAYYFGDKPSSLVFTYFDEEGNVVSDEEEIDKVVKIKVSIETTSLKFKQKIHKETTILLTRGV